MNAADGTKPKGMGMTDEQLRERCHKFMMENQVVITAEWIGGGVTIDSAMAFYREAFAAGCECASASVARKNREIEAKETELGKQDAELIVLRGAYRQLMEKAVRFAEAYHIAHLSNWIDLVDEERAEDMAKKDLVYVEAQAFLREHQS